MPEIQVFGIQLKTPELSFEVLRAIDQAVQFPIVFELAHAGRTQVVACGAPAASPSSFLGSFALTHLGRRNRESMLLTVREDQGLEHVGQATLYPPNLALGVTQATPRRATGPRQRRSS